MQRKIKGLVSAWLVAFMVILNLPIKTEALIINGDSNHITFSDGIDTTYYYGNPVGATITTNNQLNTDSDDFRSQFQFINDGHEITGWNVGKIQGFVSGMPDLLIDYYGVNDTVTLDSSSDYIIFPTWSLVTHSLKYDPVTAREVISRDRIPADVVGTKRVIRETLGELNVVDSFKVDEADEKAEVTYRAGRVNAGNFAYVLHYDEVNGFTWVASSTANEKGQLIFVVDNNKRYTLSVVLPESYKAYGWMKDMKDWYYFNADGQKVINEWVSRDASGTVWYYVGADGKMVKDTVVDGFVIDSNGEWRA